MGTTPTRPKGAVKTVMARADSERTWKMMTTSMQTIMIGITAASAVFALAASSTLAPIWTEYPAGSWSVIGLNIWVSSIVTAGGCRASSISHWTVNGRKAITPFEDRIFFTDYRCSHLIDWYHRPFAGGQRHIHESVR